MQFMSWLKQSLFQQSPRKPARRRPERRVRLAVEQLEGRTLLSTTYSLFSNTATPATVTVNDPQAVELGVKFQSNTAGSITGIRFYKGPQNTGTHVGDLWSSSGKLLASATFTNETSSGWEQVNFATSVAIQANTTYIASYHTNVGDYSVSNNYFATAGVTSGPLQAPSTTAANGNGVYKYGASAFPSQTYKGSNYWVDVVFSPASQTTTPPTVTGVNPANGSTGLSTTTSVTVQFSEALDPTTVSTTNIQLLTSANAIVPATVGYNATAFTATVTPSSPLANGATYSVLVKGGGIKDTAGDPLAANFTSSFTTAAQVATPPAVTSVSPANGSTGVATNSTVALKFNEALDSTTVNTSNIQLLTSAKVVVPATVSYNSSTFTATVTPSSALANNATYNVLVKAGGIKDTAGDALAANFTSSFTTVAATTGHVYYVSPTGSDSNSGSASSPWKTLQQAANKVVAGDTVIVAAGNYAGFVLGWNGPQNGTASAPITFQAQPGATIVSRNNKTADGIDLEGASYITVNGFTIRNTDGSITRAGVRAVNDTHVTISNNNVDGMGTWGLYSSHSDYIVISGNVTSENNANTSNNWNHHGIYVSNSAIQPTIINNVVWGNWGNGIHMNGDASQGGSGIITGALVAGNIVYNNGLNGGSAINCDGVQSSVIENNVLYNNHSSGISLYMINAAQGSKNNIVVNNTIVMASDGRWALNIQDGSTGNTILNNILYNNSGNGSISISSDSLSGTKSSYNVVKSSFSIDGSTVSLSQWQSQTGQDKNSIIATPTQLFVNASSNDYHLSSSSPAINAGTSLDAPSTDRDGNPRPSGSAYDIGAYEFQF